VLTNFLVWMFVQCNSDFEFIFRGLITKSFRWGAKPMIGHNLPPFPNWDRVMPGSCSGKKLISTPTWIVNVSENLGLSYHWLRPWFCPWKYEKKYLKSRTLSQKCRNFQYCLDGPICPTTAKVQDLFESLLYLGYIPFGAIL
jgi:hypothetical protein